MSIGMIFAFLIILITITGICQYQFQYIETQFLERINKHRRNHDCPDLQLSKDLCKTAREQAKIFGSKSTLEHVTDNALGESLCTSYDNPLNCVEDWYATEKYYDYDDPVFVEYSEDFTQMIWKSSKFLGIGLYNDTSDGRTVVVAKYYPAGNGDGLFQKNVPQPSVRSTGSYLYPFAWLFLIAALQILLF